MNVIQKSNSVFKFSLLSYSTSLLGVLSETTTTPYGYYLFLLEKSNLGIDCVPDMFTLFDVIVIRTT
jgi:hypothetical protein